MVIALACRIAIVQGTQKTLERPAAIGPAGRSLLGADPANHFVGTKLPKVRQTIHPEGLDARDDPPPKTWEESQTAGLAKVEPSSWPHGQCPTDSL